MTNRHIHEDASAAAHACAERIFALLHTILETQEIATLAVSGGSTPKLLFQALVNSGFKGERVHLFFVDERPVGPNDPQSNYGLAKEHLLSPARYPPENVHRIHGELEHNQAAARYAEDIRQFFTITGPGLPQFDIIQCGMGSEGHTASLFPGQPAIENRTEFVASVWVEKVGQWRTTLLPGVLLNAKHILMLLAGADKAPALRDVFEAKYNPLQLPAQLLTNSGLPVEWFLDRAAASRINEK